MHLLSRSALNYRANGKGRFCFFFVLCLLMQEEADVLGAGFAHLTLDAQGARLQAFSFLLNKFLNEPHGSQSCMFEEKTSVHHSVCFLVYVFSF